ncbi:MAG: glycosyltransferase [Rectinema sp.]
MKTRTAGLFVDAYTPIMDGVTLTVRNYAYWLSRYFGHASVVTPEVPYSIVDEPFPVFRFLSISTVVRPPYRIGLPDLDVRLQKYLKNKNYSIIHSHSPFSTGLVALKTAREKGVPIVTTFHSKYRDDLSRAIKVKSIVNEQIKRIIDYYYNVDHVWVPQESVAKTLRLYGYKGPYDVVENGIDMTVPDDIAPYRAHGAEYLGIPDGTPMGLFVGQQILEKNLELIVRSLPAIVDSFPDFKMMFVGQGYAKDQLRRLADSLGVGANAVFHDVVYDRELLKAIYARSDLFLFPSIYDTSGLVYREAAAFKVPAVLVRGSDAAEAVTDGDNGFLCENSIDSFAGTVVSVLGDDDRRIRVGSRARMTLCRTWEDVVKEVAERYRTILSRWSE